MSRLNLTFRLAQVKNDIIDVILIMVMVPTSFVIWSLARLAGCSGRHGFPIRFADAYYGIVYTRSEFSKRAILLDLTAGAYRATALYSECLEKLSAMVFRFGFFKLSNQLESKADHASRLAFALRSNAVDDMFRLGLDYKDVLLLDAPKESPLLSATNVWVFDGPSPELSKLFADGMPESATLPFVASCEESDQAGALLVSGNALDTASTAELGNDSVQDSASARSNSKVVRLDQWRK